MDEDLENGQSQELDDLSGVDTGSELENTEPKTTLEALERAVPIEGEAKPEDKPIEPKTPEAKKPESPDDLYKMPEGLQPKSQERFTKLVESNQQKDAELSQVREANAWITENFGKDEQGFNDLAGFAEYRNALKTGNFEAAGQLLQAQIQQFTLLTGQQLQASPLQEFPDLQQRIDAFELDEKDALEIARYRKQQAMLQGQQQQQAHTQQQQEAFKQEFQWAEQTIGQMIEQWKKTDIDYPAKEAIIAERMKDLPKGLRPSQIPDYVKILYQTVSAVQPPKSTQTQSPLRATGRGAGSAVPKTAQEAMDLALGYS